MLNLLLVKKMHQISASHSSDVMQSTSPRYVLQAYNYHSKRNGTSTVTVITVWNHTRDICNLSSKIPNCAWTTRSMKPLSYPHWLTTGIQTCDITVNRDDIHVVDQETSVTAVIAIAYLLRKKRMRRRLREKNYRKWRLARGLW